MTTTGVSYFSAADFLLHEVTTSTVSGVDYGRIVDALLEHMPEQAQKIFRYRWGFETGHEMNFHQIGTLMGIAPEDAWQMYHDVMQFFRKQIKELDSRLLESMGTSTAELIGLRATH